MGSGRGWRRRSALWALLVIAMVTGSTVTACNSGMDCNGTIRLRMAASQDKVDLLQDAADDYGRTHQVDGMCVKVTVDSKNSGTAMKALARGWNETTDGPRPDVWSPASGVWVTLLRQHLQGTDKPSPVAEGTPQPIMTSPLTIAMPKPMAQALGWPAKAIGWADLARLATDPRGWAAYGHPEWGEFRLGKTNPNLSTSGFNATVGTYRAATGTTSDLTTEDIADPRNRKFVHDIERSIMHYGPTTLTFLANLQRADDRGEALSYISAVTVEENSVWAYNQGNPMLEPKELGKHPKPKTPLVAIYPREGTIFSDHPYVPLKGLDGAKQRASDDFLAYLHGKDAQALFQKYGFRNYKGAPGDNITQANGLVPGEPRTRLELPPADVLNVVLKAWAELRKPAKVLIVLDRSGSMRASVPGTGRSKGDLAKQAAIESLSEFGAHDQVGLWTFSAGMSGARDWKELVALRPMDSAHRRSMRTALTGLTLQGGTALYNTTADAFEAMGDAVERDSINAVVVLTDGKNETAGGIDLQTLLAKLSGEKADKVRIFTIGYGADADQNVLQQIAQATDGAAYDSSDPNSIREVFQEVISNF